MSEHTFGLTDKRTVVRLVTAEHDRIHLYLLEPHCGKMHSYLLCNLDLNNRLVDLFQQIKKELDMQCVEDTLASTALIIKNMTCLNNDTDPLDIPVLAPSANKIADKLLKTIKLR